MPSGAIAISPWSDLTHCFPSTMENFATDVMPPYGFIHKPSTLWPPPTAELSEEVQGVLRRKVREIEKRVRSGRENDASELDGIAGNSKTDTGNPPTTTRGDTPLTVNTSHSHDRHVASDSTTHKGDHLPSNLNLGSNHNTPLSSHDADSASKHLHPRTSGGDSEADQKPPATTQEGKAHQSMCDPTDGKDMEMEIDGQKVVIVSCFVTWPWAA